MDMTQSVNGGEGFDQSEERTPPTLTGFEALGLVILM
jgi:hypothetical protein